VVPGGDEGGVGFWFPTEEGEEFWQGREGGKLTGIQWDKLGQPLHVGVGVDNVGVPLVYGGDCSRFSPVDEVAGKDLDFGQGDAELVAEIEEGVGRFTGFDEVRQGGRRFGGFCGDVFEDGVHVFKEEECEVFDKQCIAFGFVVAERDGGS